MLDLPYQSYVAWRSCITVFHAVAIISTLLRIWTRYKSRRMWLDDYLVIVPMTTNFVYCISPWVLPWMSPDPRTAQQFDLRGLWTTLLLVFIIVWLSRICFMLSLARIFPPGSPNRRLVLSLGFLFALLFCSVVVLLALHCDPFNNSGRHCVNFGRDDSAPKYAYSLDAIGDVIMIITPLIVLWKVKLPKLEKRVILAALSGSIITLLLFSILIFFTFGPFQRNGLPYTIVSAMLSNLTAAASLLSCNALVVVTNIYRIYRRRAVRMEEARSPETKSDDLSSRPAAHSAPAFDLEKTKDANHRSPESYGPNLYTMSDSTTDSEGSVAPFSMYNLTQITMDDYDSQYGSADLNNPRSRLSELPDSSTRAASVPGIN